MRDNLSIEQHSSTITTSEITTTTTDTGEDHSDDNFPQGQHRPWASDNHSFLMEPRSGNMTREFPDGFLEQWGSDNTTGVFPRGPGGQGFPDDEVHQMPVPVRPWSSDNGTSPKPPFSDDMNDENAGILPNEET